MPKAHSFIQKKHELLDTTTQKLLLSHFVSNLLTQKSLLIFQNSI